ncbi:hypothetical protein HYFRA_00003095 [Hymenoscyphus fraxineus]|uniref:RlpA-like protein double-psi beta-barrel domain-containing protein n=1 Tax=Hymenoscyphus fraxineus TaxID=746836 RepID=A0A9N9KQG4_9HELO|nr:hypothetical protein HYFRA_00003095 [Hymenoscyphus fraxineus]
MKFLTILSSTTFFVSLVAGFAGDATWYDPAGGIGSCGAQLWHDSDIVALGPAHAGNCGRRIWVYYNNNGRQATINAQVQDLCPGCAGDNIDLSQSKFQEMAGDLGIGRTPITCTQIPTDTPPDPGIFLLTNR